MSEKQTPTVVDMTSGVYRRIYAGFVRGKKINAVSMNAEAWFWRLHAVADDLGNLLAEPNMLASEAGGRRQIGVRQSEAWLKELVSVGLIEFYTHDGDRMIHICDFEIRQPAGKNGKRIQRVVSQTEAKQGIQNNPGESRFPQASYSYSDSDTYSDADSEIVASPADAGTPAATPPKLWGSQRWGIQFDPYARKFVGVSDADRAAWGDAYPAVSVDAVLKDAAEWCLGSPKGRKENYRKFLVGWLSREQDKGGTRHAGSNGTAPVHSPREDFDGCLPGETTLQALVRKGKL